MLRIDFQLPLTADLLYSLPLQFFKPPSQPKFCPLWNSESAYEPNQNQSPCASNSAFHPSLACAAFANFSIFLVIFHNRLRIPLKSIAGNVFVERIPIFSPLILIDDFFRPDQSMPENIRQVFKLLKVANQMPSILSIFGF